MQIQEAYDVLKDENKKRQYDNYGEEGLNQDAGGYSHNNPFSNTFHCSRGFHDDNDAFVEAISYIDSIFELLRIIFFLAQIFGIFSSRRRR